MKINGHFVVVGGAIAGIGAALLFARAGARVTLIERVSNPRAVGAGIAIAQNGWAVLESLGLAPALSRFAREASTPRIVDGAGRVLFVPPGPLDRIVMLRRSDLQQVLLDAVYAEPRIERRFGAEVISCDRNGHVELRDATGIDNVRGDLVIGADGVHSRVRAAGNYDASVSQPGISYVRALVPGDVARGEEAWTAAGLFGSFSLHEGTYVYASAGSREVQRALGAKDLGAFRDAWTRAYPVAAPIVAGIAEWDQLLINQVVRVECRRWFDERTVLVGDAAHAMAPNLGQGANSALVDVAVLLDELRRADDIASALAQYEQRRKPAVTRVARMAARLGSVAEITNPVGRWFRDRVLMPVLSRVARPTTVLQEPTETLLAIGRA